MDRTTDLVTTRELATRLRVTPDTVLSWMRKGRIPAIRLSAKVILFDVKAVVAAVRPTPPKEVSRGR